MKRHGSHPDKALSPAKVRSLKTPGRFADGNGLYLVVDPSGAKRWLLRTVVQGKRCDIGLGGLKTVSLADARNEASRLRKMARDGHNPLASRQAQKRVAPSFEDASRTVFDTHKPTWRSAKHGKQWIKSLETYAFPVFGKKSVSVITSGDVLQAITPIWTQLPETARRTLQRIRSVMDWARAAGHRADANPVDGVTRALPRKSKGPSHHSALEYRKVNRFLADLKKSDAGEVPRLAFEFAILTATRTSETLGAKWDEIDLKKKTWTIPASRMKTGAVHRVPLAPRCLEILQRARGLNPNSEHVFPGRNPKKPLSNMVFLMVLRRMNMKITAHGFRSTFRDWAAEQTNHPRAVCEMALAHTIQNKTEAAYNRSDLFDKRSVLMKDWATYCMKKIPAKKRASIGSAFPNALP